MRRVGVFILMMLAVLWLGQERVSATGCQVVVVDIEDPPGSGNWIRTNYDGCGDNWNYCDPGQYRAPDGSCHDIGDGGEDTGGGGYDYVACTSPQNVNCSANTSCVPSGQYLCNTMNINYNSSSTAAFGMPNGNADCRLGNAQSSSHSCNPWFCGYTITTYGCCPAGTVSQYYYTQGADYQMDANMCEGGQPYNCYPNFFVSTTVISQCGISVRDEEGERHPIYVYRTTCRPQPTKNYVCTSICSSTAPTNLSVVQGASATAATLSWRSGTGGTSQVIYVGTNQNSVNNDCAYGGCIISGAVLSPFYANSNFSYPVTGLSANTTYYFRVVTQQNASCRPSATTSYTTPNLTLSGRVYLDSNNNCSTATPWSLGGLTVTVRGTAYTGSVGSDGRFAFYGGTGNPISYLDLAGFGSAYTPSTATGCNAGSSLTSVANPSSTNYYYLTSLREAWWQARGAGVYANGNVRSELPSVAENLIEAGVGGELGALMRTSGSVDTGAGAVSTEGYTALTRYRGKIMNYDFFAAQLGVTPNTVNDWAADTMNKPTNNPDKVFYYLNPSGSEASVSTPWVVGSGESYIVLINGDLRIASNITVAEGGFLAFIVNGSVRVSPAVTDIAGIFDIDGAMITESNGSSDVAADFEGSVVAWGGVRLGRDLGANNSNTPGESFSYRPDLLVNMPEAMKVFALKWEEVVPGTF